MQQPAVPQVLIAFRRLKGVWECAVMANGNLDRTLTGGDFPDLIARALAEYAEIEFPDDTRAMIQFNLAIPAPPVEVPLVRP